MPYNLSERLVIGLASSALFNLEESDCVFKKKGEKAYREYQRKNQNKILKKGVAYPFISRLLQLNNLDPKNPPIEVILLSRNDPDTGLRVMNSIKHYKLNITRALFLQGRSPYAYIPAFDIELFLSANIDDINLAIENKCPAGYILKSNFSDNPDDQELRIAFDFDGVIADDEVEAVYQENKDLETFHQYEQEHENITHNPGPLKNFISRIANIQKMEQKRKEEDSSYKPVIRVSIVTARNAPSHKRVIHTMREWDIMVNEAFFLGGIEKRKVLEIIQPHIFFDDQINHLIPSAKNLPSVHIPFGITNNQALDNNKTKLKWLYRLSKVIRIKYSKSGRRQPITKAVIEK